MHQRHVTNSLSITRIMLLAVLTLPALAHAAGIKVQSGASISLGGGSIDLGCGDATIVGHLDVGTGNLISVRHFNVAGGSVNAGSGWVQLAGDWSNSGTFSAGSSQVTILDGCSTTTSVLTGNTGFYTFTVDSLYGKTLLATAGSIQVFNKSLTLEGILGNRLLIRSSQAGNQAFFSLVNGGTQNINRVDVMDNNAVGGQRLAPDIAAVFNSVDSGNNLNWFLNVRPDGIFKDSFE